MRKLKTNKTQILHNICFEKYDPQKPPDDNYQEAQWQIDDKIIEPQDNLGNLACKTVFGGHLSDIVSPYERDFDENHTQGPSSYFN